MGDLQLFQFESKNVRMVTKDGEPWFVAKDVCGVLEIGNSRDAISRLSDSMKDEVGITDTIGRNQEMTAISEAGVYKLAFTSRKPAAERFTNWLAIEVIPSIRKTGSYSVMCMEDMMIAQLQQMKDVRLQQEVQAKRLDVIEAKIAGSKNDWYSVKAYSNIHGLRLNLDQCNRLGRLASKRMRGLGYEIGKVKDERYGMVNSYPEGLLDEIFEAEGL